MPQAWGTDEKSTTHLVSLVSQIDPRATTLRKKNLKMITKRTCGICHEFTSSVRHWFGKLLCPKCHEAEILIRNLFE